MSSSSTPATSILPAWVRVPRSLTYANGAKAALMGEKFAGETVSWSAVKAVHQQVVALFEGHPDAQPDADTVAVAAASLYYGARRAQLLDASDFEALPDFERARWTTSARRLLAELGLGSVSSVVPPRELALRRLLAQMADAIEENAVIDAALRAQVRAAAHLPVAFSPDDPH